MNTYITSAARGLRPDFHQLIKVRGCVRAQRRSPHLPTGRCLKSSEPHPDRLPPHLAGDSVEGLPDVATLEFRLEEGEGLLVC